MKRELKEEINVIPARLAILGVSAKGNGYYFGFLNDEEADQVAISDEGQTFKFFAHRELARLNLGGAFKVYLDKFPSEMKSMFQMTELPTQEFGKQLSLAIWNGDSEMSDSDV